MAFPQYKLLKKYPQKDAIRSIDVFWQAVRNAVLGLIFVLLIAAPCAQLPYHADWLACVLVVLVALVI